MANCWGLCGDFCRGGTIGADELCGGWMVADRYSAGRRGVFKATGVGANTDDIS